MSQDAHDAYLRDAASDIARGSATCGSPGSYDGTDTAPPCRWVVHAAVPWLLVDHSLAREVYELDPAIGQLADLPPG